MGTFTRSSLALNMYFLCLWFGPPLLYLRITWQPGCILMFGESLISCQRKYGWSSNFVLQTLFGSLFPVFVVPMWCS